MLETEIALLEKLPAVRGSYRKHADLSKTNWFQVGGPAEIMYRPADVEDFAFFLKNKPKEIPVTVIGVGSNLLVRDGGIDGVVIRLGKGFTDIVLHDGLIEAGAGALSANVALFAEHHTIQGLEFLIGIPGTIGGALAMNAGAYHRETKDILVKAEAIDPAGNIHIFSPADMKFCYRGNGLPEGWIFTKAWFRADAGDSNLISCAMQQISERRAATQPIKNRTGGSTFANPEGNKKAWQLIDEAGCRGLSRGGAKVSEMHCNFLVNTGGATADDLESLGEEVRRKVFEQSGVMLQWEIRRIGKRK